ncbi:hypothetical protein H4R34_005120, partial [Dimargaris verticillata]
STKKKSKAQDIKNRKRKEKAMVKAMEIEEKLSQRVEESHHRADKVKTRKLLWE